MFNSEKVRFFLLDELASAQSRNPSYSMRALAKRIGVSQAAISQILAAKRPLTKKTAEKILKGLDRNPEEIWDVLQSESGDQGFKSIDMDTYHLIADWYYYAILSLTQTQDFRSEPEWIAARLGISEKVARDAVDLLLRLDLLEFDQKTKKIKSTNEQIAAISPIANAALKKACRQNIQLSEKALEETEFDERDFTAITLCFDPAKMNEAKKIIKTFRRQFCRTMESYSKKEVYKLTVQLFPLTKRGKK